MNGDLKIGQILWLKVRYQIDKVSDAKHPMLIAEINDEYIEIIAIDKTAGKLQNLYYPYNHYINSENPKETVLSEDSYAQLNTKLTIENFDELKNYRKTNDLLSKTKLNELLNEYKNYQSENRVKEERIVHMTKYEILELYLNTSYFGDGYYTVKEASKGYFNKEPNEMTDYESVLLAGIPNAPSIYSLTKNPELAKQRQKQVIDKMIEYGYLTKNEANEILTQNIN